MLCVGRLDNVVVGAAVVVVGTGCLGIEDFGGALGGSVAPVSAGGAIEAAGEKNIKNLRVTVQISVYL